MDVLILEAQERASSAIATMFVVSAGNLIGAAQEASSNTAGCDVIKRGIAYRYQLAARLSHGCLSSALWFNTR